MLLIRYLSKDLLRKKEDYYLAVYSSLPSESKTNSDFKQQYINGHFCYALKTGIVTNGLGIIRHISVLDNQFKIAHPDLNWHKSDSPSHDKELGDSALLNPVLSDFFSAHPMFHFSTFIGDSAFDSYDNYSLLKNDFHFSRVVIIPSIPVTPYIYQVRLPFLLSISNWPPFQ